MSSLRRPAFAWIIGALVLAGLAVWLARSAPSVPRATGATASAVGAAASGAEPSGDTITRPLVASFGGWEQDDPLAPRSVVLHLRDSSGQSVSGARVEVWPSEESAGGAAGSRIWSPDYDFGATPDPRPAVQPALSTVAADGSGACTVSLPAWGAVLAASVAEGGATVLSSGLLSASELWYATAPFDVVLEPVSAIDGRVLWVDGTPAVGVTVRFSDKFNVPGQDQRSAGRGAPRRPADVRTDAQGNFHATAEAQVLVEACAVSDTLRTPTYTLMSGVKGHVEELRFPGRFAVHGLVTDPQGRPLAGAKITLNRSLTPESAATSAADGRYEVQLVTAGRYDVAATSPDSSASVMADPCTVTVTDAAPVATLDIPFVTAATISVRAERDDRTPFPRVTVRAIPEARSGQQLCPQQAGAIDGYTFSADGEDGTYVLRGLHPDFTYKLSCEPHVEGGSVALGQVREGIAPGSGDVTFRFTEAERLGATIRGTVTDALSHRALADGEVTLRYLPLAFDDRPPLTFLPMDAKLQPPVRTSVMGQFAFEKLSFAHRYAIDVRAAGYALATVGPLDVRAGTGDVNIALQPVGSLRVSVTSADGTPAANATVSLMAPDTTPFPTPYFRRISRAVTDAQGVAVFPDLAPGVQSVQAFVADAHSGLVRFPVAPGEAAVLALSLNDPAPAARLQVTVLQPDGEPMPGGEVRVHWMRPKLDGAAAGGPSAWTAIASDAGIAQFENLPAGCYAVTCSDLDRGLASADISLDGAEPSALVLRTQ